MNTQLNTTGAGKNPLIQFAAWLCVFVAGMAGFSLAYADGMGHDVTRFDVAGVRLGMSYQQAKAAAAGYFEIGDTVIQAEKCIGLPVGEFAKNCGGIPNVARALCPACQNKDGTIGVGIAGSDHDPIYVGGLFFERRGGELLLTIGFAKADEISFIMLNEPKLTSPELVNKYVQELKRKYGSPSADNSSTALAFGMAVLQWCAKPEKRKNGEYNCNTKPEQSRMVFLLVPGGTATLTLTRKTDK